MLNSHVGLCAPSPVVATACTLLPCFPSVPRTSLPWASLPSSHPKRDFKKCSSLWIGAGLVLTFAELRLLFLSDREERAEDAAESRRRIV